MTMRKRSHFKYFKNGNNQFEKDNMGCTDGIVGEKEDEKVSKNNGKKKA